MVKIKSLKNASEESDRDPTDVSQSFLERAITWLHPSAPSVI